MRSSLRQATAEGNLLPNVAEKSAARARATAMDFSPGGSPVGSKMAQ